MSPAIVVPQVPTIPEFLPHEIPWSTVGYLTYKRTYSRRLIEDDVTGPTEEWPHTIERNINGAVAQLNVDLTEDEKHRLRYYMTKLKGTVAGRFLWQLGTETITRLGLPSLQNCAFVVVDSPIRPFTWTMDMLMLGSGVGFNIQRKFVDQLPAVKKSFKAPTRHDKANADFIVPDTREGWVALLERTLESAFARRKSEHFRYSTQLIRGKGAPIKGFGGVASGPEILCEGIDSISKILTKRAGLKLRPIDCLDIMNIIGSIVVAGNVRRSAQLAIGDPDDIEYLLAKRWDIGNIPPWRSMSNNSVACDDISQLHEFFWDGYEGKGEPYGLINLNLSRQIGRLGETQYADPLVEGYNPCQPEFATILTPEGVKTFGDLKIGDIIWSKQGWTKVLNKWSTGVKPVYASHTTGGVFVGTLNHRVDTLDGKVAIGDADSVLTIAGDFTPITNHDPQTVMDGIFFGDGYHKKMIGREYTYPVLTIGHKDHDYFTSEVASFIKVQFSWDATRQDWRVDTTITTEEKARAHELVVPDRLYLKDPTQTASFLRGLFTADGCVVRQVGRGVRVNYKTASKTLARQVVQMLSSIGIRSYITTTKANDVTFNNGTYTCKESYNVNITKDVARFAASVGFVQSYKTTLIEEALQNGFTSNARDTYTSKVEVEYLGDHEVFDITVDNESHTYWTGGLSVSNCAEQSLANFETCCLAEIYLPNIDSYDEFVDVMTLLYRICKHSLALGCHNKETEKIVNAQMRMGIGVTGYLQASAKQKKWLAPAYEYLRQFDEQYSKKHGFPVSVKLTTCKPSGTLSLLPGVTPGAHPGYAQYMIRRISMASNHPLVDVCRNHGYEVEYRLNFDGTADRSTMVVSFPYAYPEGTVLAKDMTAIDQLKVVRELQQNWSDNSVSVTVYYRKEELPEIKKYLAKYYATGHKSLSFLLHSEHGFAQAPYEEITKEKYDELVAKTTLITSITDGEIGLDDDCATGACPVR